jgi:hypothetical protein
MEKKPPKSKNKLPAVQAGAEFDCVECGRRVVKFESLPEPGFLLCCECVFYPGWFKDERLAFVLDPWHCRNPPPHEL